MMLVLSNGTQTELVQCEDCDDYTMHEDAEDLGWLTNADGDWKCAGCFERWVY